MMRRWKEKPSTRITTSSSTARTQMMLKRARNNKSKEKTPRMSRTSVKVISRKKMTYLNKRMMLMTERASMNKR